MFCSAASVRTVRKDIHKAQTDKALIFKNKCVLVGSSTVASLLSLKIMKVLMCWDLCNCKGGKVMADGCKSFVLLVKSI